MPLSNVEKGLRKSETEFDSQKPNKRKTEKAILGVSKRDYMRTDSGNDEMTTGSPIMNAKHDEVIEAGKQIDDSVTKSKQESEGVKTSERKGKGTVSKTKMDITLNQQTSDKSPGKERGKKEAIGKSPQKGAGKERLHTGKNLMETPKKRVTESPSPKKTISRKALSGSASKAKSSEAPQQQDSSEGWSTDDDDDSFDSSLERKAKKINMSVKNVKSLIHYVLSDEQVKRMFEDALAKESTPENVPVPIPIPVTPKKPDTKNSNEGNELDYVPKLTRAKMKDWMEKVNSPVKQQKPGSSILDVDFGEEEDDEEYSPDKDECNETDDESIVSSQMSEFGSPCPRTPGTPVPLRIIEDPSLNLSPTVWNKTFETDTSKGGLNLSVQEDEGTIALRTRSKLPLKDTLLDDIEEAFVAPDITADLYDTNYDDEEWTHFLSTLYKTTDDSIADDEANDPEFNYIAEAEREQVDDEDFRFDKPTKISKKELNTLIEELHSLFDEDEVLPYQVVAGVSTQPISQNLPSSMSNPMASAPVTLKRSSQSSQPSFSQPLPTEMHFHTDQLGTTCPQFKTPQMPPWQETQIAPPPSAVINETTDLEPVSSVVSAHQRALIKDNLRKHIQLLAQSFLLTHKNPEAETMAGTARNLLTELGNLRQSSPLGTYSVINVCNLDPALSAVNAYSVSGSPVVKNQHYHEQKFIIFGSPAFLYSHLLPSFKFSNKKKERQSYRKNKFLPSENNLIALGLEQFADCQGVYPEELIHKLLIRGKTVNQIYHHVRFLSSTMASINAVKKLRRLNQAVQLDPPTLHPVDFRASQEKDVTNLPTWCQEITKLSKASTIRSQANLPQQSLPSLVHPINTFTTSSAATSSFHSVIQTPVVHYSGNDVVLCETVTGHSRLVSPIQKHIEPCSNVKQNSHYCKILPMNPSPASQSNKKQTSEDSMSLNNYPNLPSESPVSMEEVSHSISPPHITSSPKCSSSPASVTKSVSFYDSPSVYAKAPSPTAVVTPNASKGVSRPPTVRNLGPEFDKHDDIITQPDTVELNVAQSSPVECSADIATQRASLVDPDLLLPHSPPKRISKDLLNRKPNQVIIEEKSSFVVMPSSKGDAKDCDKPLTPSNTDSSKDSSQCKETSEEKAVSKGEPSNVKAVKGGKTLQLTVISKPLFQTVKKVKGAVPSVIEKPSEDGNRTLGNKEHSESQVLKEKVRKTKPKVLPDKNVIHIEMAKSKTNPGSNPKEKKRCGGSTSTDPSSEGNASAIIREDISLKDSDQMDVDSTDIGTAASQPCIIENVTSQSSTVVTSAKSSSAASQPCIVESVTSQSSSVVLSASLSPSPPVVSTQRLDSSPIKISAENEPVRDGMKTPNKLRPLAPKESLPTQSPTYVPLPKISPRRKKKNWQIRQILPKLIIFDCKNISPTKAAALVLKKKALCQQRSPVKILSRPVQVSPAKRPTTPRSLARVSRTSARLQQRRASSAAMLEQCVEIKDEPPKETEERNVESPKETEERNVESPKDMEESETSEVEDSSGMALDEEDDKKEQINLDDLMAACTTIGFASKNSNIDDDVKGKSKKQKELTLLQPDLVESDPKKDERDTAFAQCYFDEVKKALQDDPQRFRKFLELLKDMNKNPRSPVELYADIVSLLSDHQQLVEDFAGFLLSFQALECQCFISNHQISQIRRFLRQIEVHCGPSASTFHKVLRVLASWLDVYKEEDLPNLCVREKITGILKNIPGVLDDLICYFLDGPLPESHGDDFEDVDLLEDPETIDEFEDVVLPHGGESYNTKMCSCQCHSNESDEKHQRRIKHCVSCSLKMYAGQPVLNMSRGQFRPIRVVYPLEEKEKLIKAKKEAAQIALAKARAQRQKKGKKKKPIKKLKPKKKGTGKLKRRTRRRKATSSKKPVSTPLLPEKKINDTSSNQKGTTTIKIRFDGGTAKVVSPPGKDSVTDDLDSEDSSSVGTDERQLTTAKVTEHTADGTSEIVIAPHTDSKAASDKMVVKMPFLRSTSSHKDPTLQTSNVAQGHSVLVSNSSRKRQSSQMSQVESLHSPPAKKHASSAIDARVVEKEESNISDNNSVQGITTGPHTDALQPVDVSVPTQDVNSCVPEGSSSQIENQTTYARQVPVSAPAEMPMDSGGISESNEEFDRCVLNNMSYEGITEEGVQAIQELMPERSVKEIHDRAVKLLEMLENMSDATTDMDDDEVQ